MKKIWIMSILMGMIFVLADDAKIGERVQYNAVIKDTTSGFKVMYRHQIDDKSNTGVGVDSLKTFIQPGYDFGFGKNKKWDVQYRFSKRDGSKEERFRVTYKGYHFTDWFKLGARYEYNWSDEGMAQKGCDTWGWFRLQAGTQYKINNKVVLSNLFSPRWYVHMDNDTHNNKIFAYQNHIMFIININESVILKPGIESFIYPERMNKRDEHYTRFDVVYKF